MKTSTILAIVVLLTILPPTQCRIRPIRRRSPSVQVMKEKKEAAEAQMSPYQLELKKAQVKKNKENGFIMIFGTLLMFCLGVVLFRRGEKPAGSTHIPVKHKKLDPDIAYYLKHGMHPSQVGVRKRNELKKCLE